MTNTFYYLFSDTVSYHWLLSNILLNSRPLYEAIKGRKQIVTQIHAWNIFNIFFPFFLITSISIIFPWTFWMGRKNYRVINDEKSEIKRKLATLVSIIFYFLLEEYDARHMFWTWFFEVGSLEWFVWVQDTLSTPLIISYIQWRKYM